MSRSVRIHAFGGADVLRIEDVAIGKPGAGEVRLRIHAIGLNRTELTLRSGRSPVKPTLPSSIGSATWVAFGMAWSGLVAAGALAAEQSVVISAASSAVGLAAMQIANFLGATPIALTRTSS